jgi:hypothetical protein
MNTISAASRPPARVSARRLGALLLALPVAAALAEENTGEPSGGRAAETRRGQAGVTGADTPGLRAEDSAGQRGADTVGSRRADARAESEARPQAGPVPPSGPSLSDPRGGAAERVGERDTAQPVVEPAPTSPGAGATVSDRDAADAVEEARRRHMSGARPGDNARDASGEPIVGRTGGVGEGQDAAGTAEQQRQRALQQQSQAQQQQQQQANPPRDTQTTARMLGEASFVYRDRAMAMAERELNDGQALGSAIIRNSELLSGEARTQLNDRIIRMNEARTQFAQAISSARAANEPRWEELRRDVVDRYNAYMSAIEEARAAAIRGGQQSQEPGRLLPAPTAP